MTALANLASLNLTLCAALALVGVSSMAADSFVLSDVVQNPSTKTFRFSGFGTSVAMDGALAVVGAPEAKTEEAEELISTKAGLAQVYDVATQELLFRLKRPKGAPVRNFGKRVAISGTLVAVGTDSQVVFVYDLATAQPEIPRWTISDPVPVRDPIFSDFGISLALNGHKLVIGNVSTSKGGSAYCYDLASTRPTKPLVTLHNPKPSNFVDWYGSAVAVSGHWVVVGCYLYDLRRALPHMPVGRFKTDAPLSYEVGYACAAIHDNRAAIGYKANVYIYQLDAADPLSAVGSVTGFHRSVAWAGDQLVVATKGSLSPSGSVEVYQSWSGGVRRLPLPSSSRFDDGAGLSQVAANDDWILVGSTGLALLSNSGTQAVRGNALLYSTDGNGSEPSAQLEDSSRFSGEDFGRTVAVSGPLLAVGAPLEDDESPYHIYDSGAVYVYDRQATNPTIPVAVLRDGYSGSSYGRFGYKLAISGRKIVVATTEARQFLDAPATSLFLFNLDAPSTRLAFPVSRLVEGGFVKMALSASERWLVASGLHNGVRGIYVFDLLSEDPTQVRFTLERPSENGTPFHPDALAVSGNLVAASSPGKTHVYRLDSSSPTSPLFSMASGGTKVVIAGSHVAVSSQGTVKLFDLQSDAPDAPVKQWSGGPAFGSTLAASGDLFLISDTSPSDAPVARLFSASRQSGQDELQTLGPLHSERAVKQGPISLAFDGSSIAIGDTIRSVVNAHDGIVYLHRLDSATTTAPTLQSPRAGAHVGRRMRVDFTLPETASPGSVKLVVGSHQWVLGANFESAGQHSLEIDALTPQESTGDVTGSYPGEGWHEVRLEYRDLVSNAVVGTRVRNIKIDTIPPTITALQPVKLQSLKGTAVIGHFPTPTVFDSSPIVNFSLSHRSGTKFAAGLTDVTGTATDLAGNSATERFQVSVMGISILSPANGSTQAQRSDGILVRGTIVGNANTIVLHHPQKGDVPVFVGKGSPELREWKVLLPDLPPALNTLEAHASDGVQEVRTQQTSFFHQVLVPITTRVTPEGAGRITFRPALLPGGMAVVGKSYTVSAASKLGFHFSHWGSNPTAISSDGAFIAPAKSNEIIATFIPTPFTPDSTGTFQALLIDTEKQENTGSFSLRLSANTGAFTARITQDGISNQFSGTFDPITQSHTRFFSEEKGYTWTLSFEKDQGDENSPGIVPTIRGIVIKGEWDDPARREYQLSAPRIHDSRMPPPTDSRGVFNVGLSAPESTSSAGSDRIPTGYGWFTAKISRTGAVACAGRLTDGTAFASGLGLALTGELRVCSSFERRTGLLVADLRMDTADQERDLAGDAHWFKRASRSPYYPAGFTGSLLMNATGASAATSRPETLQLGKQIGIVVGIEAETEHLLLTQTSSLGWSRSNPNSASIKFSSSGKMTGHFTHSRYGKCSLAGLIVQKNSLGQVYGFALTPTTPSGAPASGGSILVFPDEEGIGW